MGILAVIFLAVFMVAVVGVIVFMETGQRRIPVQYAKRIVGEKNVRRADDTPAAQGQHVGRHPAHLRVVDHHVPGDPGAVHPAPVDEVRFPTR